MRNQQRGMAMLVVLFILVVMVIVAVNMNEYWQRAMLRSQYSQEQLQARWSLLGAEALLRERLIQTLKDTTEITLQQEWLQATNNLILEGINARGMMRDRQNCFNINSLSLSAAQQSQQQSRLQQDVDFGKGSPDGKRYPPSSAGNTAADSATVPSVPYPVRVFSQLLINLGVEKEQVPAMTRSVTEWFSSTEHPSVKSGQQPPTGDKSVKLMAEVSELRGIATIDQPLYHSLLTQVCVHPDNELKLNINTLNKQQAVLFSALFLGRLTPQQAEHVLNTRPSVGWKKIEELQGVAIINSLLTQEIQKTFTLESHYFETLLWLESAPYYPLRSMIWRDKDQWQVLQRRYGISE